MDTVKIDYKVIDITEPGHEEERELLKEVCKKRNSESLPLPPQFFNDDDYCGVSNDFSIHNTFKCLYLFYPLTLSKNTFSGKSEKNIYIYIYIDIYHNPFS